MRIKIRDDRLLYHLTSLDNIESILNYGLLPRSNLIQSGLGKFHDVANPDIIAFREREGLNKYVPFHFFAQNPFDGDVQKRYSKKEFIYICVDRELAQYRNYKVIPKHPLSMEKLELYDYQRGMEAVDWEIMELRDYSDWKCKQVCMAECISSEVIEPDSFSCIFVRSNETAKYIINRTKDIFGRQLFTVHLNSNLFIG